MAPAAAWLTVMVWPETVTVPVRAAPVLAKTERYLNRPHIHDLSVAIQFALPAGAQWSNWPTLRARKKCEAKCNDGWFCATSAE